MASRSRFYVDTPRDPSQRHSMFVSHSELAQGVDQSSNSSSATLPSAAGSVDRLTGLEEKKQSRFFTLKPKSSFSLKPFFRSSSSLVSLSPGKNRKNKKILERRDSGSQTDESRPEFEEIGVQTLNASTVDVPVQTCLQTWDESDSYGQRRLAYAPASRASPFWSRPYAPLSGLSNSTTAKNVPKDPLASPNLLKYVAPVDFTTKTSTSNLSTISPADVNSCQLVTIPVSAPDSTKVPVTYFSAKELKSNITPLSVDYPREKVNRTSVLSSKKTYDNLCSTSDTKEIEKDFSKNESSMPEALVDNSAEKLTDSKSKIESLPPGTQPTANKTSQVSTDSIASEIQIIECPSVSVLKTDRTDSPSRRHKTVHFDLPSPEPQTAVILPPLKERNLDKDFEALLKDLNVWTDDDSELEISFDSGPRNTAPIPVLLSPNLKSAIDCLKQDFLAPIPETSTECIEDDQNNESCKHTISTINNECSEITDNELVVTSEKKETDDVKPDILSTKPSLSRSVSEYDNQVSLEINKNDSVTQISQPLFTSSNSGTNVETDSLEGNVYDNVIKEENSVQTVPLPTLPSFFEPPSQPQVLETTEIVEYVNENSSGHPSCSEEQLTMPFDSDFERNRLSRSSSRSSIRSNSKLGMEVLEEPVNRFDSCENLDQLEEEIIRSLYSPDEGELKETIMKNIELPPSESFQNSGTTATHMRRVILDQLLSGKTVEDIVPNCPKHQKSTVSDIRSKYKPVKKYTAVLTKLEIDNSENNPENVTTFRDIHTESNLHSDPKVDLPLQKKIDKIQSSNFSTPQKIDSPKKTSIFLFPEMDLTNNKVPEKPAVEIFENIPQNRGSSVLEVRRSSWTPQTCIDTSNSVSSNNPKNSVGSSETLLGSESGHCDFSNCLKPSKIQNSPFLEKINTRSISPCNVRSLPPQNSTFKRQNSPVKLAEAVGECDFGSCLKPSQVQNSLFTKELSVLTNNSANTLRSGSPLTVRLNSPLPVRHSSLDRSLPSQVVSENASEPTSHKSELSIVLQPKADYSFSEEIKSHPLQTSEIVKKPENFTLTTFSEKEILVNNSESNKSQREILNPAIPECSKPVPPPPPPPLPSSQNLKSLNPKEPSTPVETMTRDQNSNLNCLPSPPESTCETSKLPVVTEFKIRLETQNKAENFKVLDGDNTNFNSQPSSTPIDSPNDRKYGNSNFSPNYLNGNKSQNGGHNVLSNQRNHVPEINGRSNGNHMYGPRLTYSTNTVVTDEPPPLGAVLLDKKITIEGDKVHTDKYFAIPIKEVTKEKTSTTKFTPAPPKYEGIGPTEDGVPIGLRNSVKKENMHNWYKTMFKSLHKADSSNDAQEYIIGYTSEPETSKRDLVVRKKSSTLDSRLKHDVNSNYKQNYPSAKSSIEVYNVRPRLIEDYEPGYSSVTDDEVVTSRRYLPALKTPKPSYEFKNGYESDTTVTRKHNQPEALSPDQQKMWYREIQRGADIPQFGLGKPAPEKPTDPVIGPLPPPPLNYNGPITQQQGVRPSTLPANYCNQNGNGYCQQMNGAYEMQMRNAIHSEMQQRQSPSSNQLSPPVRTMGKSPSRSPDLKIPAQALFDFKAESPKEISLRKGDVVLILRQLDKNWYEGEHKGFVGIFPINYVEIVPPEHASTPIKPKPEGLGRAMYDFVAQTSIELTVRKGETVTLLRRVDSNWFEAVFKGKKGIIPISYIQVLQEPGERNINSPPRSCPISPSSESREKLQKINSLSPSAYSSSSTSPLPVSPILKTPESQERRKLISKKSSNLIEPVMYRALYSYSPQNSDELELQEGDSVCVVEMCDDGWFVGTSVRTGVFGIFPGNYVEKSS